MHVFQQIQRSATSSSLPFTPNLILAQTAHGSGTEY